MKKALFIDRDGTIIAEPADEQIDSLEKLAFVPGAISALKALTGLGFDLVLATNQDGLGTPSFPEDTFWPAHNKMLATLGGEGVAFDDQLIDRTFEADAAPTRKPRTGMFGRYTGGEYDLAASYVIGDRVTDILEDHTDLPVVESFSRGAFTLFVGSSWQPDEDFIIPYFNKHPEMKMVLAPHEISEDRISGILTGLKRPVVRYTKTTPEEAAEADCLILDCYGILSKSYRFATVAYVGGGFGVGIHNINEAAVYGIPVVFGPKYGKFKEARDLIALEGAFTVSGGDEYALVMNRLLSDGEYLKKHGEIAGGYIRDNLGATRRIYDAIFK